MNSFYEHHRDSIRWHYRCFDRILLNGLIQPFQQPERVVGFFNTYRQLYPVSRNVLRGIADQFQMRKSMTRSALNSIASTTASSMISMRSSSRWPQSRMTTLENENKIPTTHGLMDVQWQNKAKLINLFKSVAPLAIARRHCAADFGSWRLTQSAGW
jgi:hypothetical protein